MAENTGIEWATHTFNPWIGCTKISEACDFCYAADWDKRFNGGEHWGAKAPRQRTSIANWNLPLKWNREAEKSGVRPRVFCASLADVFDNQVEDVWRDDLWDLIEKTPFLDWLLLTKRPQNIYKKLPSDWGGGYKNVWLGTTVEHQKAADMNIPHLMSVPAAVRFLSCEPLLGPIRLDDVKFKLGDPTNGKILQANCLNMGVRFTSPEKMNIDWVIAGGESGPNFRAGNPDWFRSLRDQCAAANTPFLFKQWEGASQKIIKAKGRELDGVIHNGYPK